MLKRFSVHICLIMLFAIAQTGIFTHEVSHFEEHTKQSQNSKKNDQNTAESHCEQCLAHAQADDTNTITTIDFAFTQESYLLATIYVANLVSKLTKPFSARAPPSTLKSLA